MEAIETVIIGGGQAGLATSYYLTQHAREHLVLEQADRAASAWRDGRWDSFTLVTPNWTMRMPGAEYDGPEPGGFLPRDEIVAYFERYVERFRLPVRYRCSVTAVEPLERGGYRVRTARGEIQARNVVVATGFEQAPKVPPFAAEISPEITQLHSSLYRNPGQLPEGAVLVVGSGQSGAQIAEELYQSGRQVFLATGSAGRAPRRYRGKDGFEWLLTIGFFDMPPEKMPFPKGHFAPPHLSGAHGGHSLNLHQFARDGVTLLGHARGAEGDVISFAPDLHENLGKVDGFEIQYTKMVDGYIQAKGINAPLEELPVLRDGYAQPGILELNLRAAGVRSILWATGYSHDYSLVKLQVQDADGFPVQQRGVSAHTGLYFVGMPWMPTLKSGILAGVGDFARDVAGQIAQVKVAA